VKVKLTDSSTVNDLKLLYLLCKIIGSFGDSPTKFFPVVLLVHYYRKKRNIRKQFLPVKLGISLLLQGAVWTKGRSCRKFEKYYTEARNN
jgi:hypothetical protein